MTKAGARGRSESETGGYFLEVAVPIQAIPKAAEATFPDTVVGPDPA